MKYTRKILRIWILTDFRWLKKVECKQGIEQTSRMLVYRGGCKYIKISREGHIKRAIDVDWEL